MKKCRLLAWGLISALVLNQAVIPAAASELTSVRAGAKKTTALISDRGQCKAARDR